MIASVTTFSSPAFAQASPPTPSTLVSVCSGVSLPPSIVTGIIGPVLTGSVTPLETAVNGLLGIVLPSDPPLTFDVSGLLAAAAAGDPVSLAVVAEDGTLVGPSDQCDASADSYSLDNAAGISIGGNQITGLGDPGEKAVAGEIDSIAIGNRASTDASAADSIAIGPDATVGANADGSIAFGSAAEADAANSVAIGAGSIADRGALTGISVGEVSVGSDGNERQITHVAAGTEDTDAVNLAQLNAAIFGGSPLAVLYDNMTFAIITLQGTGGTLVTNVAPGTLSATSTDAVNGSQLYATNQQVAANTQAITNLQNNGGGGGATGPSPVAYSDPATPTVPNGGTQTNDATLVGASSGPVALHNVADGAIAPGSTDAVNGGQIYELSLGVSNAVSYDDDSHTSVTLNPGGTSVAIHNVADGVEPTDAVNVGQLNGARDEAVSIANSYTDSRVSVLGDEIESLNFDLRRVGRDAHAGTAGALAAAGMPQSMDSGRAMVAGGMGVYRGRVGVAIGGSYRAPNGQSVYKVGLTYDSSSHVGANAGVGFQF